MKKYFSRTFRIGRLSVSLLIDEVIIIYRGNRKLYLKKIEHVGPWMLKKPLIAGVAAIFLVAGISFFNHDDPPRIESVQSEDEMKDKLLTSSETDFTEQKEEPSVVIKKHIVKNGQTLSQIAKIHGISMDTICGSNNLNSYDLITVGTVLKVPSRDGVVYSLKSGEQISAVAKKYKVPLEKVLAVNEVRNVDFFHPNQSIFIPDAKPLNLIRGFLWPTSRRSITSGYGWRRHPIFRHRHFHKGLDIYCHYEWIKATKFGKVTYAGWLGGYGKAVIISHPGGWKSLYGHLSRFSVRHGQYVKQGQIIAKSGNTGNSTGPHLHFEIINNGTHKNPYRLLK